MKYGYARVSTYGQKLETQIELLKNEGVDKIYKEKFTGTTTDRPELTKVLSVMHSNDQLIVTKLDRLARNTQEALKIVIELFDRNITVNILNLGTINSSPVGILTFTIFSAFAQFERDMIVSRTQEGKRYAKKHNPEFKEGRPITYTEKDIRTAYALKQTGLTYKQVSFRTGISTRTLQRRFAELNNQKS